MHHKNNIDNHNSLNLAHLNQPAAAHAFHVGLNSIYSIWVKHTSLTVQFFWNFLDK